MRVRASEAVMRLAGAMSVRKLRAILRAGHQIWAGRPWCPRCAECSRRIWPWCEGQTDSPGIWEHLPCVTKRLLRDWLAAAIDEDIFTVFPATPQEGQGTG